MQKFTRVPLFPLFRFFRSIKPFSPRLVLLSCVETAARPTFPCSYKPKKRCTTDTRYYISVHRVGNGRLLSSNIRFRQVTIVRIRDMTFIFNKQLWCPPGSFFMKFITENGKNTYDTSIYRITPDSRRIAFH